MAPTKAWLSAVGLCLISSSAATRLGAKIITKPQSHSEANLVRIAKPSFRVHVGKVDGVSRRQDEACYGTCVTCFGDDYRECPNNKRVCWSPNDPTSGCDPGFLDFDFDFPDFDDFPGGTEYCTSGESCAECFGDSYELCPDTTNVCWSPEDPDTFCDGNIWDDPFPDDSDDIDMPGDINYCIGESCVDCFGSGYELCPGSTLWCWNPDIPSSATVCDSDGSLDDDDTDDDDDDDSAIDEYPLPTRSRDPVPTLPPWSTDKESATEPTSGAEDDGNDDSSSDGHLEGETAGGSSDDDDSAAVRIGMGRLPVIAGAVGVAALL